jgi:hypothetical protein
MFVVFGSVGETRWDRQKEDSGAIEDGQIYKTKTKNDNDKERSYKIIDL